MTPRVGQIGPYRFYFFSHEPNEPAHIHVDREKFSAKYWLDPVSLAHNIGFSPTELKKIESIVSRNSKEFLEVWNEFFQS
ncbi:MAG: DUF4160 domain-containing protein [Candidatus Riflebacteria bacterium]|nr:DUF4160 domain-containing protein [Candidatus Riflebacteria bacterium]